MTLRIQTNSDGHSTTIRLIGRIRSEYLQELQGQLADAGSKVVLDLEEVTLVDLGVVRFLGSCEANGAEIKHCSPYIREWMLRELGEQNRQAP